MLRRSAAVLAAAAMLAACAADPGVRSGTANSGGPTAPVDGTTTSPATPTTGSGQPGTTVPPPTTVVPGAHDGTGDRLFPQLGFTGIDVQHYDVTIDYHPDQQSIDGAVVADITATTALTEFWLDSVGLDISQVTVDGAPVAFQTQRGELVITLPAPVSAGTSFTTEVTYSGRPNAAASAVGIPNGWFHSPGGSYVLNEPDGARTWMPCNDHPSDKASFTFHLGVPAGMAAVANGELVSHDTEAAGERWTWDQAEPTATYLILLLTGQYEIAESQSSSGVPILSVALTQDADLLARYNELTARQIDFFEQYFGPYPLARYGVALTDSFGGLAMETQGRSMFSSEDIGGRFDYGENLLLGHELAHQWFGDAVTPADWGDIWLNESFATYGEWMWLEEAGLGTVDDSARNALANRPPGATGTPSVGEMFGYNSYDGGAAVVHALRRTIGDDAFFTLLRRWIGENNGTSRTTADFIALAQQVAGQDLTAFFDTWLFATRPPSSFP
ncbi:MAG: M1 family metallopeptidase [Ilumatobacter sp.]|nr:M1 family metallopeptidase [Ilumatobacter sp.]